MASAEDAATKSPVPTTTNEKQALANNATEGNTTDDYSPVEPGTDEGSSPDHTAIATAAAAK